MSTVSGTQPLTIKQALSKAKKATKQGNLAEAVHLYNAVLKQQPNHPVAKKALKKLAQTQPTSKPLNQAATNPPQAEIDALMKLYHSGQMLQTEKVCLELLKTYPESLFVLNILAVAFHGQGKLQEALELYKVTIKLKPDYADAHYNCGLILQSLGESQQAVECYDQAISLKPDYAEAYNNRGNALRDMDMLEAAMESYNKAIQIKPDSQEVYLNLCEVYDRLHMVAELEKTLQQAQQLLPEDDPTLLYHRAHLANRNKSLEEARDLLERIDPEQLPLKLRRGYSELLGKTYDKLNQFSKAFVQFEISNTITRDSTDKRSISDQRYFNQIISLSESWGHAGKLEWPAIQASADEPSLAFLIGFPRSGTTLLDTILRSHPDVSVVEEKPMVTAMKQHMAELAIPERLTSLDTEQISVLRKVYFDELYTQISGGDTRRLIIDKFPLNIIHVGLIHRVFPEAKFILALRHPCDCVLSCFMQNFKLNDAMMNFLELEQSSRLYDAVMGLWQHYNNVLELDVGTLKYEDLVQDIRGTVEPLLTFLDLDWHENLHNYQQTALSRDVIRTPSYNQVTQGLYTQASGRWKNYQQQMQVTMPFLEPWARRFGYAT